MYIFEFPLSALSMGLGRSLLHVLATAEDKNVLALLPGVARGGVGMQ